MILSGVYEPIISGMCFIFTVNRIYEKQIYNTVNLLFINTIDSQNKTHTRYIHRKSAKLKSTCPMIITNSEV